MWARIRRRIDWRAVSALGVYLGLKTAFQATYPEVANDPKWLQLGNLLLLVGVFCAIVWSIERYGASLPTPPVVESPPQAPMAPRPVSPVSTFVVVLVVGVMASFTGLYVLVRFIKWAWTD